MTFLFHVMPVDPCKYSMPGLQSCDAATAGSHMCLKLYALQSNKCSLLLVRC